MINKYLTIKYSTSAVLAVLFIMGFPEHNPMAKPQNPANRGCFHEEFEKATFAAGCFWHVEYAFSQTPGVISTKAGYTGGKTTNPTYKQICTDKTGHAEAVEVTFDPSRVTYEQLLEAFWQMHDPTQLNRQGPDFGTQYHSAIFFHNQEQENAAKASKEKLQASGKYVKSIVTEIIPAEKFYPAEEYHQKYFQKHGKTCFR